MSEKLEKNETFGTETAFSRIVPISSNLLKKLSLIQILSHVTENPTKTLPARGNCHFLP